MYEIKQLEWEDEQNGYNDIEAKYVAYTSFGYYSVELIDGEWYVNYCFSEYYDDGYINKASSLHRAKEIAAEHWKKRLEKDLRYFD